MKFNTGSLATLVIGVGGASAFSTTRSTRSVAFVGQSRSVSTGKTRKGGCNCPLCTSSGCSCPACRGMTMLLSDATDGAAEAVVADAPAVPAEVESLDGVENEEEAHNVDRPARQQIKKKKKGKELSEFAAGSMVPGTVRSITNYGAFIDFGATTDGLAHISQLAPGYVASVGDVLEQGQEVEARIVSIDSAKGQVALSLLTEEQEAAEKAGGNNKRQGGGGGGNRREDSAVIAALSAKGWDTAAFVEGTVVRAVDFGCFVRFDASKLNSEIEGEMDGLVHISALQAGRVNSVTDVVKTNQKVQIRVKSIDGNKVSLTMLSVEDEESKKNSFGGGGGPREVEGAKDWKESLEKFEASGPEFRNDPIVEDLRK